MDCFLYDGDQRQERVNYNFKDLIKIFVDL